MGMKRKTGAIGIIIAGIIILVGIRLLATGSADTLEAQDQSRAKPEPSVPVDDNLKSWIADGQRDLSKGIELAKARGTHMRELIRSNPAQAIREALSLSE